MTDNILADDILANTARRLFAGRVTPDILRLAEEGHWPADLWAAVEEMGLPLALVPEEAGGFGLDIVEALGLVRIAGSAAAPLPLADSMLAAWMLAGAGLEVPAGPLTVAPPVAPPKAGRATPLLLIRDTGGWQLSGTADRVPWDATRRPSPCWPSMMAARMSSASTPGTGRLPRPAATSPASRVTACASVSRWPTTVSLRRRMGWMGPSCTAWAPPCAASPWPGPWSGCWT